MSGYANGDPVVCEKCGTLVEKRALLGWKDLGTAELVICLQCWDGIYQSIRSKCHGRGINDVIQMINEEIPIRTFIAMREKKDDPLLNKALERYG